MSSTSLPPLASPATTASDRRASTRHAPDTRAAVWFDFGPEIGETCPLSDLSLGGFAVDCNEWQWQAFLGSEGRPMYCVLLLGAAHFGCMAHVAKAGGAHSRRLGFQFDAVPHQSERLLQGLIDTWAARDAQRASEQGTT